MSSSNRHHYEAETPTVGPLRITKSPGASPPHMAPGSSAPGASHFYYPPPKSSSPSFTAGAQSSAPQTNGRTTSRTHTPADDGSRRSSGAYPVASSTSPHPPFDAPDTQRLPGHSYGQPSFRHGDEEEDEDDMPSIQTRYAQRHANANSALRQPIDSPDGLFQKPLRRPTASADDEQTSTASASSAAQVYYPPPPAANRLQAQPQAQSQAGSGVNRFASTASVSTTRASRGSPPPPETPADVAPVGSGIEARYAAAGIAGPDTLTNLQARSLAAQQRQQVYVASPQPRQHLMSPAPNHTETQRRWTPTEHPSAAQPLVTAQDNPSNVNGAAFQLSSPPMRSPTSSATGAARESLLEQDMNRLNISEEPPPAYSSVSAAQAAYPAEKSRPQASSQPRQSMPQQAAASSSAVPNPHDHPAFAHDPARPPEPASARTSVLSPTPSSAVNGQALHTPALTPSPAPSRSSPPPLPEGWLAHLDPNSGQYYYIHLATQSTQWEFPKGPTPLSLNEPPTSPTGTIVGNPFASPTASVFSGHPLASPGFGPERQSAVSMSTLTSPTIASFSSLPPNAGVDLYRVAPANGVYFGPYLRYTNMDVDNGIWYGSILLVTDAPHPPTIHIHQSTDLSPSPRQLKANHIFQHQRWSFYRYDIDLRMEDDHDAKWTYAVTSHLGCTRYEFLVAGRYETSWRILGHSGNDFAMNVKADERSRLGGPTVMWKDIMQKHMDCGGFHCQLGLGNQIYADRMWKEIPSLRQWTNISGKENRKNAQWTAHHEEEVTHAYFHYYSSHFDQPLLREAFAQIPHVLTLDDHDIFDGFGSYPEHMQFSNMFKNIGRIGVEMYLLFQHHTTISILRSVTTDFDLFTITGTGWHFIKYLGPAVVVVAPDCRSERNQHQVMAGPTYQGLFPKIAVLAPHVQHCILMIPVPLVYPRFDSAEQFAQTMATGKRAVTGTFNALTKVTSGVAGIVGAKGVVNESLTSIKKAVGKSGLMSNVLSPFGEIDLLDELRDQWTHDSKDLERTYLIRTLQSIAAKKALRMTFFSGSTNACGAGLVHNPTRVADHKTMYQVISSSVVNAPPSPYVLRMLHPREPRPLYVPANGTRSGPVHAQRESDTKEDMLDVFGHDVNGQARELKRLMGRRNYITVVPFDPEALEDQHDSMVSGKAPSKNGSGGMLSLAVNFFVQGDGATMGGGVVTANYGPLTVPGLTPGH